MENASLAQCGWEPVGISGLIGSGRTELALALFGMKPDFTGTVQNSTQRKFIQRQFRKGSPAASPMPEDRLTEGLFLTQSIERNIIVTSIEKFVRGLFHRPQTS